MIGTYARRIMKASVTTPLFILLMIFLAAFIFVAEIAIGVAKAFWNAAEFITDGIQVGIEGVASKDGH